MDNYDIITIGSATRDVYLESSAFKSVKTKEFKAEEAICIPEGSKVPIESVHFTTGGSAVNTAATFANQGFKTGIISKIGNDLNGKAIKVRLENDKIATDFLVYDNIFQTAYSIIVHAPNGGRTILVHRGASAHFSLKEFDFNVLKKTKWIYTSHLGGKSAQIFNPLIKIAHDNGVRIALNPGSTQLNLGEELIPVLDKIDILFVNQEEGSVLTGIDYKKEDEIFKKLDKWVKGIVVMTKGPKGVVVSDGVTRREAGIVQEPDFIDRTGAGDAFASAFTSAIMRSESILDAIQLGSTNAASVLGQWGANRGLLAKDDKPDKFGKLEIKETKI